MTYELPKDPYSMKSLAKWDFQKFSNPEESAEVLEQLHLDGAVKARKAFRELAKPGGTVTVAYRPDKGCPTHANFFFAVGDRPIGMLMAVSIQLSVGSGLTLSLSWPRPGGPDIQEVWEIGAVSPAAPFDPPAEWRGTVPGTVGLTFELIRDLHEGKPVDAETLLTNQ